MTYQDLPATGSRFWRDAVANFAALPARGISPGECRLAIDTRIIYEWNGTSWQAIANGAQGDALAATVAGFTSGAVVIAGGGTLTQDPTKLFWDIASARLGVGTNNPQYPLDVLANNTYPSGDPSNANLALAYGLALNGYPTGSYTYQYRVYAYKTVSGTKYYSAVPSTTSSLTDNGGMVTAPTSALNANINYGGSGYTASGNTWTFDIWTKVTNANGVDVWSQTPGTSTVMDDGSFANYSIDINWVGTTPMFVDAILVRNGSDYIQFGGPVTSFNDTNSGWSFGGFGPPSPLLIPDTVQPIISWTADPVITPDGYIVLKYSTQSGFNFDYYYDTMSTGTSLADTNTFVWTASPTITPNAQLGDALRVQGNVGFYDATPVPQYVPTGAGGFTPNFGSVVYDISTWTGGIGTTAYKFDEIVEALKLVGIVAL